MTEGTRREELLDRVRSLLDSLGEEPPPEGVDPALLDEPGGGVPDLATLSAAVACAAREVEIQGKILKRLVDGIEPVRGAVEDVAAQIAAIHVPEPADWTRAISEARKQAKGEGADERLGDLIEIYHRLARCVAESERSRRALALPARWAGAGKILEGVTRGVALTLERLREILERAGVRPIESTGRPFDATTMHAVDVVAPKSGSPPGIVVETLREGFVRGPHVLRFAEVRVARESGKETT